MCLGNATCPIRKQRMMQPPLSSCLDGQPWGTQVETACPPSGQQPPRTRPEEPRDEEAGHWLQAAGVQVRERPQGAQPQALPKHRDPLNSWAEMSGNLWCLHDLIFFFPITPLYSGLSFSRAVPHCCLRGRLPGLKSSESPLNKASGYDFFSVDTPCDLSTECSFLSFWIVSQTTSLPFCSLHWSPSHSLPREWVLGVRVVSSQHRPPANSSWAPSRPPPHQLCRRHPFSSLSQGLSCMLTPFPCNTDVEGTLHCHFQSWLYLLYEIC